MAADGSIQENKTILQTVILIFAQISVIAMIASQYVHVYIQHTEQVIKYIKIKCTSARMLYNDEIIVYNIYV